ncbi:MAG: helix-turn-helix transcriptional regulator [Clostridia bacterium]|nr:helix-turn-helix transcriptional regulator [Clostridia bacterium]
MNLADELGVSFQAVSNWERGNSMPDISKLPEIAECLNSTIDFILGNSNETQVKKISSQRILK